MIEHDCEPNSEAWLKLRCGIPTSSPASKIVTSKGEPSSSMGDYAEMLAGERYAMETYGDGQIDDFAGNKHTERGHEFEPDALKYYSFISGYKTRKASFITTDDLSAGSSPDSFAFKSEDDEGLVEAKCLGYKEHIKVCLYYKKHGKIPAKYRVQKQDQMLVCEKQWNDSVFYHPKLPSLIVRCSRDNDIIFALVAQKAKLIEERDIVLKILQAV